MSPSALVHSLINAPMSAALRAHGFEGKLPVYRRGLLGGKQVVQLQIQKGTGAGAAAFVLNLGVLHPEVDRLLRRPRVANPRETQCTVRTRIGPRPGSKSWWTLKPTDTAAPSSLLTRIEKGVIPWLAMASDLAALNEAIESATDVWSDDRLVGMGVALALGDRALARTRLEQVTAEIQAVREARAAQFPRDPFGKDVLRRATKLGQEHGFR